MTAATLDVIVPVRRRALLDRVLRSFRRNTVMPAAITLVSNELDPAAVDARGMPVRIVRFESDHYPIGCHDAVLRRNIGIWASACSHVLTFDDDQVAPLTLVESALRVLEQRPVCWGHYRFIDIDAHPFDDLLTLPPEAGRTREHPPNAWHSWRSAYGGLFAADRELLLAVGAFDMAYLGRHGGEDQDLGRRLAARLQGNESVYVHEPPFAWHPEHRVPWDEARHATVCAGGHDTVTGDLDGLPAELCTRCRHYLIADEALAGTALRLRFDPSRVQTTILA